MERVGEMIFKKTKYSFDKLCKSAIFLKNSFKHFKTSHLNSLMD